MTYIYDWPTIPEVLAIQCPKCGSEAVFRFPFTVLTYLPQRGGIARLARRYSISGYSGPGSAGPSEDAMREIAKMFSNTHVEYWNGLYVLVHFPGIFPWTPPPEKQPYELEREWGVSSCTNCGYQGKHKLAWPD